MKVTYCGSQRKIEWMGVAFDLNVPVTLDGHNSLHRAIVAKAKNNPAFKVEDADIADIEVVEVHNVPEVETVEYVSDDEPTDYVTDEQLEKDELRAELKALGVVPGPRTGLEKLREMADAHRHDGERMVTIGE